MMYDEEIFTRSYFTYDEDSPRKKEYETWCSYMKMKYHIDLRNVHGFIFQMGSTYCSGERKDLLCSGGDLLLIDIEKERGIKKLNPGKKIKREDYCIRLNESETFRLLMSRPAPWIEKEAQEEIFPSEMREPPGTEYTQTFYMFNAIRNEVLKVHSDMGGIIPFFREETKYSRSYW